MFAIGSSTRTASMTKRVSSECIRVIVVGRFSDSFYLWPARYSLNVKGGVAACFAATRLSWGTRSGLPFPAPFLTHRGRFIYLFIYKICIAHFTYREIRSNDAQGDYYLAKD